MEGAIAASGAKNSALGILAATLAVRGRVTLSNVPRIDEVDRFLALLASIGAGVSWRVDGRLGIDTSGELRLAGIDAELCARMRSSLLLLGGLAGREKTYCLPRPGGCRLGERTVRPHQYVLRAFGVEMDATDGAFFVRNDLRSPGRVVMYESGDTPTENAIMAAALSSGATNIVFASANYMVQDLCRFLNAAGARISGIGTTTLAVSGVSALHDVPEYEIMPDPIEAMAFLSLGISAHSELTVRDCALDFLDLELAKLSVMGQKYVVSNENLTASGCRLGDITIYPSRLSALPDKLYGRPYPGINIDNVPLFVPIFTQADGRSLVHDWVYENRAIYALDLAKMGARVTLLDPHRLFIEGPTRLSGAALHAPPAIRPAMSMLIAMVAAEGESFLIDPMHLDRGHAALPERLRSIGAKVERVEYSAP